jgi:hypothetical protein
MAEDENILARWSRLKREHADDKDKQKPAAPTSEAPSASQTPSEATDHTSPAPFDVSELPPIESIVAGGDVRAFLQNGVPAALTRAALRRAWSSDPAIRDFIEMAENQWDFVHPESIPGFGSLNAGDNVPELVAKALGEWVNHTKPGGENIVADAPGADAPRTDPTAMSWGPSNQGANPSDPSAPAMGDAAAHKAGTSAPQQVRCDAAAGVSPTPRVRRGHGGALPS